MGSELNFLFVGLIWGVTNPFIKRGSLGMNKRKESDNHINQLIADTRFLILNRNYLIPFLIANCGSVIYYFTLQKTDLTVAVPFTNSLTFLFTAATGWMLGEQKPNVATVVGMISIMIGIYCYVLHSA